MLPRTAQALSPSSQASQGGKQGGGWGTPWQGPLCLLWSGGLGGCESESHDPGQNRGIPQLLPPIPWPAEGLEKGPGGGVSLKTLQASELSEDNVWCLGHESICPSLTL